MCMHVKNFWVGKSCTHLEKYEADYFDFVYSLCEHDLVNMHNLLSVEVYKSEIVVEGNWQDTSYNSVQLHS